MTGKEVVLVIDDEVINRKILRQILQNDYIVIEASDGEEGLQLLKANEEIKAVLLDMIMPKMNGYEFLSEVKKLGYENVPLIVTTSAAQQNDEVQALVSGAWDFIRKPYNPPIILTRLRNAIARSQVAVYEQLRKTLSHDNLTGLHVRNKMFDNTKVMLTDNPDKKFAFMRLDVDHFSLFNASFGEKEGDLLIKFLATSIQDVAAKFTKCTYGRIGADVFCFCVEYDNKQVIEDLVAELQKRLSGYRTDYLLQLSVGIYLVKDNELPVDELYFRASIASKNCKEIYGKHFAYYDEKARDVLERDIRISNDMETALAQEQFVVYIQPKFNVTIEKVCGGEALVRWNHPTKGLVMPGEFIPVFEKNGFINKLDYYIWDHTCAILKKWVDEGKTPYPISVNISRISLYNPQLVEVLVELINKYQLASSLLQLEITESAYMSNPELMEKTIDDLHEAGFTILMDDFGSGYSSLNTLKRIYIDILKIDMKFLPISEEIERGEIILASIIKMANLLGMDVETEGVETRQQKEFLEGAGCTCIQGYYYSKPIPWQEFEEKYLGNNILEKEEEEKLLAKEAEKYNTTILVIDDSETECAVLKECLKDSYHVKTACSVEKGLIYLKNNISRVKLILLDNIMPGVNGVDFMKICQLDKEISSIPIILITADDSIETHVLAFENGAYDYICKPINKEILLARVSNVLRISSKSQAFDSFENEYKEMFQKDNLTGLLNRKAFFDIANGIITKENATSNALMIIDVDNFKGVNDVYGHLSGDDVLRCIGKQVTSILRKTDYVGRFGGDEFIALLTNTEDEVAVKRKANEIIKAVTLSCARQYNVDTSVSIGISFSNYDTEEAVFARADQALYQAKNTGKAKACIYGEQLASVNEDDAPVVLICTTDAQLYPAIAVSFEEVIVFENITSYQELMAAFKKYQKRIAVICLDVQKKACDDSDEFYQFLIANGAGKTIPIVAFYKEGNMDQIREAAKLDIADLISMPLHTEMIKHRLSAAITLHQLLIENN